LPFIVAAAILDRRKMDGLSQTRSDNTAYVAVLENRQTLLTPFLYIGTFGGRLSASRSHCRW
jgi:hypothetical protein